MENQPLLKKLESSKTEIEKLKQSIFLKDEEITILKYAQNILLNEYIEITKNLPLLIVPNYLLIKPLKKPFDNYLKTSQLQYLFPFFSLKEIIKLTTLSKYFRYNCKTFLKDNLNNNSLLPLPTNIKERTTVIQNRGIEIIDSIQPQDINELKAVRIPNQKIVDLIIFIALLQGNNQKQWEEVRSIIYDAHFLTNLKNLHLDEITETNYKNAVNFIKDKKYSIDIIRNVSITGAKIFDWINVIIEVFDLRFSLKKYLELKQNLEKFISN